MVSFFSPPHGTASGCRLLCSRCCSSHEPIDTNLYIAFKPQTNFALQQQFLAFLGRAPLPPTAESRPALGRRFLAKPISSDTWWLECRSGEWAQGRIPLQNAFSGADTGSGLCCRHSKTSCNLSSRKRLCQKSCQAGTTRGGGLRFSRTLHWFRPEKLHKLFPYVVGTRTDTSLRKCGCGATVSARNYPRRRPGAAGHPSRAASTPYSTGPG